ncbi:MAG TPA: choice-of-anchor tandem repeat GloVer-containing protein [Terriglobia bacterium]|nr:choice-of-anchor tandem repeat GloVer-containing protein [Terriglobia bacterium]
MNKPSWWKATCVCVLCASMPVVSPAQTFTILFNFDSTNGALPIGGLVQATGGSFYGTTDIGGNSAGTVFRITREGKLGTLHSFTTTDGAYVETGLLQAWDGDFYRTTTQGGANGSGTVFKITADGTLTTRYSFCSLANCADGSAPLATLIQVPTETSTGPRTRAGPYGAGTVFRITTGGKLTTLQTFDDDDGQASIGALVQATNGKFYGTTYLGGTNGFGTVFEITAGGKFRTLHNFCSEPGCGDGILPVAGLVQAADGSFYGTNNGGGANNAGSVFKINAWAR